MHRIELSETEKESLRKTFKNTKDLRLRARCQAVLMAARKRPRHQIAQDLEVHVSTLRHWLGAYRRAGLEGLKIQWAPGKEPIIPQEITSEIINWVKQGPAKCGLDRANWTYEELANYLYKQKGIKVARSTMRYFCVKHHIHPYKPTYDYRRADPQAQKKAKEELQQLKKS